MGSVKRRRVARRLKAVILPVLGFSIVGIFSIVIVKRALSASTVIVCMFLSIEGQPKFEVLFCQGLFQLGSKLLQH